jgi:hypothetical protein
MFTDKKVPRQRPLVILVNVGWRGGKTFCCEECRDETDYLKLKLLRIIFKNSVRTLNRKQPFTTTRIKRLMMFQEKITVYIQNHAKPINTITAFLTAKVAGTYSYH